MTTTDPRFAYASNGKQVGLDWTRLGYESNPVHPIADTQSGTSKEAAVS